MKDVTEPILPEWYINTIHLMKKGGSTIWISSNNGSPKKNTHWWLEFSQERRLMVRQEEH